MLPPTKSRSVLGQLGPGLAIAATGVGAADLVTASVAGSKHGNVLLWAVVVGAVLKYVLNESVARWQLATGYSVFEGWSRFLGRGVVYCFLVYLLLWSFFVTGGLIVAVGLAAHSLVPTVSALWWSIGQAIIAYVLVLLGSYNRFEQLIKIFVGLMFLAIMGCALAVGVSPDSWVKPQIPAGSLAFTLSLIGGVGGSVTMLAYGYWIAEKNWSGIRWLKIVRTDLAIGYGLTGLFAMGVMLLSTEVLFKQQIEVAGQQGVIRMAAILEDSLGDTGRWIFLLGFWAAVFTSLLGVLQGVPYLFSDFVFSLSSRTAKDRGRYVHPQAIEYRIFLAWMVFPSMLMLSFERPLFIIVIYAAVSALFLPFLAVTLLLLNNRRSWIGEGNQNGFFANVVLVGAVALFLYLGVQAVLDKL